MASFLERLRLFTIGVTGAPSLLVCQMIGILRMWTIPTGVVSIKMQEGATMVLFVDLAAQCAPQIPADLLGAIASIESGLQPLMVRTSTAREIAGSAGEGVAVAVGRLDAGHDVAIGLMGLDARTLGAAGLSYSEAFDACRNLETAGHVVDGMLKAAEKMGLSPSKAERHVIRAYFQRSLARTETVDAYEARVIAEKQSLGPGLNRLTPLHARWLRWLNPSAVGQ